MFKMLTLDCTFTSCRTQVTNNSEAICIALYNAHIATHTATGASGAAPKSRAPPVERPKIEVGTSLVDWEFFKSVFKSFKVATDVRPDKAVHQLLGCLDNNLLKLLYRENDEPKGFTEENLLNLIKCIAVKSENVWCLREKLHQMT